MNRVSPLCFRWAAAPALLSLCAAFAQGQAPAPSTSLLPPAYVSAAAGAVDLSAGVEMSSSRSEVVAPPAAAGVSAPDAALPSAPSATALRLNAGELADSPEPLAPQASGAATPNVAPKLTKYIPSGMTGQSITAHDKVLIGLRDLYSPLNFLAMVASAGYEQALNGEPNYGTDRGAFGQRLGAAAIRESTQGLFTDSVFAPMFHEDPRYYVLGKGHSFLARAAYAATRPLVTRSDSGNSSVNAALLAGYAASSGLTYAYYPQINRNFRDTVSTFGGSLGGAALGFAVSEFSDDFLKAVHIKK